jgi:hypothetical protein
LLWIKMQIDLTKLGHNVIGSGIDPETFALVFVLESGEEIIMTLELFEAMKKRVEKKHLDLNCILEQLIHEPDCKGA